MLIFLIFQNALQQVHVHERTVPDQLVGCGSEFLLSPITSSVDVSLATQEQFTDALDSSLFSDDGVDWTEPDLEQLD